MATGVCPYVNPLLSAPAIMRVSNLVCGVSPVIGQAAAACTRACSAATFEDVLPANAAVLSAVHVPAGSEYGEGAADIAYPRNPTNLPETCAVVVNVTTSSESSYRFGIFLPAEWNSRFLQVGNGGFSGGINWLDMGAGIRYGFAVASTDTGHNSTSGDVSWALNNPGRKADFGYRSIHGSTTLGKAITERYYSKKIAYSYYSGASTGGRQGLREAQYSPESFDGLLIGAPAWYTSHMQPWSTKIATYNLPKSDPKAIPTQLFNVIAAEVIKQCDAVDGVSDGIVSAPDLCKFDVNALHCGAEGVNASACLSSAQIETVHKIYSDYYADGKFAFPGLEVSSEAQWSFLLGGDAPTSLGDGYVQYFLLDDPSWTWQNYTDDIVWKADKEDPGNTTADHYEDLRPVRDRGSKIVMYHGMADALIAQRSSNVFYDRVADVFGGHNELQSWFRFFLVPGLQHVTGTPVKAPWYFAGANSQATLGTDVYSTPGFEDAQHDILLALMDWVEEGKPIDQVIATTWINQTVPSSGVLRQRPLCPFPQRATYDGVGDVDAADSWSCKTW